MNRLFHFASAIIAMLVIANGAMSQEIVYYGEKPRKVTVFSKGETLMVFPAAPYARICQPANVVEMEPVKDMQDLNRHLVPRGIHYQDLQLSEAARGVVKEEDRLSFLLKLLPKKKVGAANCSITLSNNDIVNVRFQLSSSVFRPIIPFQNILAKMARDSVLTDLLDASAVFKAVLRGQKPSFLTDVTPTNQKGRLLQKFSKKASYTLTYVGTDHVHYKAWTIAGRAKRTFHEPNLQPNATNHFYYSAIRPLNSLKDPLTGPVSFLPSRKQKFVWYVLTLSDVTPKEILRSLP